MQGAGLVIALAGPEPDGSLLAGAAGANSVGAIRWQPSFPRCCKTKGAF